MLTPSGVWLRCDPSFCSRGSPRKIDQRWLPNFKWNSPHTKLIVKTSTAQFTYYGAIKCWLKCISLTDCYTQISRRNTGMCVITCLNISSYTWVYFYEHLVLNTTFTNRFLQYSFYVWNLCTILMKSFGQMFTSIWL